MPLSRRFAGLLDRTRMLLAPGRAVAPVMALAKVPATVPACRCPGCCRCAGMVPERLLQKIERECEFYRSVM